MFQYEKSSAAVKSAVEKTSSTLGDLGSAISQKIGGIKESGTFKSFEEKVSGAVGVVKSKVGGQTHEIDEALKEVEGHGQPPHEADHPVQSDHQPDPIGKPLA
ncbi:unnamed protein product [Darwinula stevensoni]|uniref:Uncharacterized protein n=1 Tax=Darwinula stevensoni TaxID=69355 RepID=A0A7R8XBD8_9CRUS|nr:unnamed protein product [Darwinula stevensoni]CAG0886501.1 unnamed protein product [Darwinula stevensoni]